MGLAARLTRSWMVLAAVTTLAVGLAVGAFALSRSSVFHVRHVAVTGNAHFSKRELISMSGITTRSNALWLDRGAAERRLEQSPWIARARVTVGFPWSVTVSVVERRPVAVASAEERLLWIASDGTPLGPVRNVGGLPKIVVPPAAAIDGAPPSLDGAARAIGSLPSDLASRVRRVVLGLDGTLELHVAGGPRILYGRASDLREKGSRLASILAWADAEGERLTEVDLSSPSAPAAILFP